jgi:alkylation response protein AidB-like acyl-CoA dehydrogenase
MDTVPPSTGLPGTGLPGTEPPSTDDFRVGLRKWLDSHHLWPYQGTQSGIASMEEQLARVRRELWDAGWMRYGWPESVGGLGGPATLRAVLGEEIVARDLVDSGFWSLIEILIPAVIDNAPELAAELVPKMLSGQEHWCQGFSEPGSGSDLASLSTKAVPAGDGETWTVNGQKIWTSLAQHSRRCFLLTRTAPGHGGITVFLLDIADPSGEPLPGITIRPIRTMDGTEEFCEVFFDDVTVPSSRMVGQPGDGWKIASSLLPYERSTCFWHRTAYLFNRLDQLIEQTEDNDEAALGSAYLSLYTARCRSAGTVRRFDDGGILGAETSVDKILLQTAEQELFDTARDLLPGMVNLDRESADVAEWQSEYLYSRAATIYGGTAEIQRNIVARRLLDLGKE